MPIIGILARINHYIRNHLVMISLVTLLSIITLTMYHKLPIQDIDNFLFGQTNIPLSANLLLSKPRPHCSNASVRLIGQMPIDKVAHSWDVIRAKYVNVGINPHLKSTDQYKPVKRNIQLKGIHRSVVIWTPHSCATNMSVAVIIPYRNRDEHLRILTNHLHMFLRHQLLSYTIFVIEQVGETTFNRGTLLNIGHLEVTMFPEYKCLILHDVDKLPENDYISYSCYQQPTLLSSALSEFGYNLLYKAFFGGVVAIAREQFVKVHGFSNMYYGWGGEDDDFMLRISTAGYQADRISTVIGRYLMLPHNTDKHNSKNPNRYKLLASAKDRIKVDGLNTTKYKIHNHESVYGGLLQLISVSIPAPSMQNGTTSTTYHQKQNQSVHVIHEQKG